MTDLIWSFSPWLTFLAATRITSVYGGVAAGVAAAAIVAGRAVARRRLHLLDAAGLCYFLVLGAVLVATHPGHLELWSRYAQAGSHAALTVIVFGSVLAGHPFTESYARQAAPAAAWHTRQFHAINQHISAVWGLAFLAGTLSLVIAGSTDDRPVLLRIIVPFGALYLAYRYTQKQTKRAKDASPPDQAAASGASGPAPARPSRQQTGHTA